MAVYGAVRRVELRILRSSGDSHRERSRSGNGALRIWPRRAAAFGRQTGPGSVQNGRARITHAASDDPGPVICVLCGDGQLDVSYFALPVDCRPGPIDRHAAVVPPKRTATPG